MLGGFLKSSLSSTIAKLDGFAKSKGITPLHLTLVMWGTGIVTLVAFGLQYFLTGILFFLLHRLTIAVMDSGQSEKDHLLRDYFIITGSLMAMLWTAGNAALPVAFMFWAIMMNLLGTLTFKPQMVVIDLFEISLLLILIALAPNFIPAIAILFGAACLISLCASYLQTFRK
ncbi:MAG TPA: hypothetical protein PKI93_01300 [Alphaproteobacteria bacterium]|nr:hypothetical protein [Alphaproteobacteria bacterium]HNS44433.1 hypothetical protein [Alphaproteobacteria bacterium]